MIQSDGTHADTAHFTMPGVVTKISNGPAREAAE